MSGRIEQLSLAALRMAASGFSDDAEVLADWLYRFGTWPRTPATDRDFGPEDDPMAVLGLTVGGGARRLLETAYDATSIAGWYSFARTTSEPQLTAARKLYVSPRPDALPEAFPQIVSALVRFDVRSFKVGRGAEGLLRPDKIIVYFDDPADMQALADALTRALRGCPSQGVPFTAEAGGGDGLVSWGVDPPPDDARKSWRAWVTSRLAGGLIAQRQETGDVRVGDVRAVIQRAGVDPRTWQPTAPSCASEAPP